MTENQIAVSVEVSLRPGDAYSPFAWTTYNLIRLVALVLVGVVLFDVYPARYGEPAAEPLLALLWGCMLMLTAALALFGIPYLRMQMLFRRTPAFKKTKRYSFSPEGMHFASEDATGDYKWSAFQRIVETRDVFMIFQTPRSATIIPKRCFASSEEIQVLRKIIVESFKGKWRLRRD